MAYEFPSNCPDVGDKVRLTRGEASVVESQVVGRRFLDNKPDGNDVYLPSIFLADGSVVLQEADGWDWFPLPSKLSHSEEDKAKGFWTLVRIP